MAGKGKRFGDFLSAKPLIQVDGKPMMEHIVNYFPRKSEFIFLCNQDHLNKTNISKVLKRISPSSKIISVGEDMLHGPAYTCLAAFDDISDDEDIIVNYCDFIQEWDYNKFCEILKEKNPAGAIVSFKGFHPSSLGDTLYAYMKVNDEGFVKDIKEKESFSKNKMDDYGSTGTYYFSNGKLFKEYVKKLIDNPANAINGEFYMSLPFKLMIQDSLKILNFEVKKFICLGTPRDYSLYKFWSEFFLQYAPNFITFDNVNLNVTNIFPLAGGEKDFKDIGYDVPNFMIPIMNKTLIDYSFRSNPRGIKNVFIGLNKEKEYFDNLPICKDYSSEVVYIDDIKRGNASTIYELKDKIDPESPVCICGSTYILNYNEKKMMNLMEKEDIDIILFSFTHHECVLRNPDGFAYAKLKNNIEVEQIIEKRTLSNNPYLDHALTGTTIFKKAKYLFDSIEEEIKNNKTGKIYYLSCINNIIKKRKVAIFEVDRFVPIRNIINYKEMMYWQDYFDKLSYHPYSKMLQ
ncbi:MAG: sugar phosphate nucleotidyltransferase [Candidatus Woesearchaeota archaeon]